MDVVTDRNFREAYLFWSECPDVGPVKLKKLIDAFGSVENAYKIGYEDLAKILGSELAKRVVKFRISWNVNSVIVRLVKSEVRVIDREEDIYPNMLKELEYMPYLIYVKSQSGTDVREVFQKNSVAVVGSRKITAYGKQITENIVDDLVESGVVIVSGMMYGVDEIAHRTAIADGGITIGVWAGGIDTLWGTSREPIAKSILESGGLIISEFPLGVTPTPGLFPARNRIVSGLSLATVVIEATVDSGSLITAGYAAEQGREVFAVPGPVTSPQSLGTARLIQKGAMLAISGKEILEVLGIDKINSGKSKKFTKAEVVFDSEEEKTVVEILRQEQRHADDLVRITGWETGKLTSVLSVLELKGVVKNFGGMVYGLI